MKISKLHIDQFRHLEHLDFDFTYPEDFHIAEKRGKPLDKICFIGQSATGKTGLLELIYSEISSFHNLRKISKNEILNVGSLNNPNIEFLFESNGISYKNNFGKIEIDNEVFELFEGGYNGGAKDLLDNSNKIFYITAEVLSKHNIKLFEEETVLLIERYKSIKENIINDSHYNLKFDDKVDHLIIIGLLEENINFLQKFIDFATELINSGNVLDNSSQKKVDNWKYKNVNPLIRFSTKLNIFFKKINLEVDLVNTKNISPLKHIISGENIPIKNTSTGTKQLLLTAFLLYKLDTKDAIILIDEPERSLYPDMQMDLMEYYQNLAPQAQFIVATHSPFIAASFEPEERFILYFDEEGKVAVRRGTSPIGDDPNDMLKNDFGLEFLMNKKGVEAFERYRDLKKRIASENNEVEKDKLLEEILSLANAYKF